MSLTIPSDIQVRVNHTAPSSDILSADALEFLVALCREFREPIQQILTTREAIRQRYQAGECPGFAATTSELRSKKWRVQAIPESLQMRGIELTGPADRKTLINGLNAPVAGFMADLDNALSPSWPRVLEAQRNLRDALKGTIEYFEEDGRQYRLRPNIATLHVRPRSLHMQEKHLEVDSHPVPAALVDVGLYLFHNATTLSERGQGAYFYLAKLQNGAEAAVWADILRFAAEKLALPAGFVKCTVLLETLPAAFQLHEILYALREYAVAINFGRWDYIADCIRCLQGQSFWQMPDRQDLDNNQAFLDAASQWLIQVARERGVLPMGGTSAHIPVRNDEQAHRQAMQAIQREKIRDKAFGFRGTWIAHPDLALPVSQILELAPETNEDSAAVNGRELSEDEWRSLLLQSPVGDTTDAGLRNNLVIAVQYLQAWLAGRGCIPLYNLMEDAATMEVCRLSVWHWAQRGNVHLTDGRLVTQELIRETLKEEMANIAAEVGSAAFATEGYQRAADLLLALCFADVAPPYFGPVAYAAMDPLPSP